MHACMHACRDLGPLGTISTTRIPQTSIGCESRYLNPKPQTLVLVMILAEMGGGAGKAVSEA